FWRVKKHHNIRYKGILCREVRESMMTTVRNRNMFGGGKWVEKQATINVYDPQDNTLITTVPGGNAADMLHAIDEAAEGPKSAAKVAVHERVAILNKVADYVKEYQDLFAITIATEGSKTITEARSEVSRCIETLRISAEEARRI